MGLLIIAIIAGRRRRLRSPGRKRSIGKGSDGNCKNGPMKMQNDGEKTEMEHDEWWQKYALPCPDRINKGLDMCYQKERGGSPVFCNQEGCILLKNERRAYALAKARGQTTDDGPSYHVTVPETPENIEKYEAIARRQEDLILRFITGKICYTFRTTDLEDEDPPILAPGTPHSSYIRAVSNLRKQGKIVRAGKVMGTLGHLVWTYELKDEKEGGEENYDVQ
jgi:hypothetical protein